MPVTPLSQCLTFEVDIQDRHLVYEYEDRDCEGNSIQKCYELWFHSKDWIVYSICGDPISSRKSFYYATYQCLRPGELWQCSWLEETGTICSIIYDIPQQCITTMIGLSKGHWEGIDATHGDKQNPEDLERWARLANIGNQAERKIISQQVIISYEFRGRGSLEPIEPTFTL
ncbi:Calycin-like protein [Aspergillus ambiguus]|uniref:Calycin-like protein n=1 Tax=Aspergillus ambiguus TaxID=176160 RepID=UPI003CCDA897